MSGNDSGGATTVTNGSSSLEIAQSNQDLIISKGNKRKRTWIIAGVICAILVALVVAAIILIRNGTDPHIRNEELTLADSLKLEDFLYGKFNPRSFNGTWKSGHEFLYTTQDGHLVLYDLLKNTQEILLTSNDSILHTAFDFQISADGQYMFVAYEYQKLYRHSYKARYKIINIKTGDRTDLLAPNGHPFLQLVVWSPVGNALVYVFENNIYYKSSITDNNVNAITNTVGFITNGVPDWVYEEEVFSSNKALWFSPDGKKLVFGRFNDTNTSVMVVSIYGEPGSPLFQYPRPSIVKYPKAGTPNPTVTLHFVNLENPSTATIVLLEPSNNLASKEPILTSVVWATNDIVTAIWMNRVQNQASIISYSTEAPFSTQVIQNVKQEGGWIELFTPPRFSKDGSEMVLLLSQDQGNGLGSYRHLTLLKRESNAKQEPLTKGAYVVTEILGWNHEANLIYYTANTEEDASVQHVYSVSPETKNITCLSCNAKSKNNPKAYCLYNNAEFSTDSSFFILTCGGPEVPQVTIHNSNGSETLLWDKNEDLHLMVATKAMPTVRKFEFKVAGGFTAKVMLKLPPNLDTSGNTKYPMLVNVYGGPDTFQVIDKFTLDWGSYLAANKSIIYATIDGRGSGLRGDKMLFTGYRKLGTVEVIDQINVTRLIQESLPYVDATKTAIWGWSYGGYASGMALATDTAGVFKCGISVAPVTDWALYDSIYTERFMGLPTTEDNLQGYMNAQLFTKYEGLRNKEYFLIHGTFDDNVHYQQSLLWAKILERHDILFRQLSYTDEDHSLGSVRPHLYHSLENFLDDCFLTRSE